MSDDRPPKIAEKIKFWEEQDKINQAIIPRVIEMNEALGDIAKQVGNVTSLISSSEARVTQKLKESSVALTAELQTFKAKFDSSLNESDQRQNELNARLAELETRVDQKLKETLEGLTTEMETVMARQSKLDERLIELNKWERFLSSYRRLLPIALIAFAFGIVSLVISLIIILS